MKIELYEKGTGNPLEEISDIAALRIETICAEIQVLNMLTGSGERKAKEIDCGRIDLFIKE